MSSIDPEEARDGEFIDELRADWQALGRGSSMPPDELDQQDQATRAAVSWMQDAWASLREEEVPPMPVAIARAHRAKGSPARHRRALWVASGLAAIAIAIAGAALLSSGPGESPFPGTPAGERIAAGPPDESRSAPTVVSPTDLEKPRAAAPIRTFTPDQFVSRPDGMEIVTGKVRIVLLQTNR